MRILYLADIRFPLERANGIQTFETCRALAARGHQVRLVTRPDTHAPPRDPWRFYDAPPLSGLTFETVPGRASAGDRVRYLTAAMRSAIAGGADVIFTRDLGVASVLARLPRSVRPPLVYESHGDAAAFSRELPQMIDGAAPPSAAKLARLERRERRVWRAADGYITLTGAHLDELSARYGVRRAAAAIPDGTRPAEAPFTPPPAGEPPLVGYAGHLYPWKGVDVLLRALARVPAARALIVGGQPGEADRDRLETLAGALGIGERVQFTGWIPPAGVARQLTRCSLLVLPNVRTRTSERYTSPLKLFEYLAAGRPIVASDLPALREILVHERNAVLVPAGDEEALAGAMTALLLDGSRAERIARQAFEDSARFTWDARAARIEAVLAAAGAGA